MRTVDSSRLAFALLGFVMACGARAPAAPDAPPAARAAVSAPTASVRSLPPPTVAIPVDDAPIEWAVFRPDGALVAASKEAAFVLESTPSIEGDGGASSRCRATRRVPMAIADLVGTTGAPRFVLTGADHKMSLWDAATLAAVAPIEHPTPERGAVITADGSLVAALGCAEIKDPQYATSCGELYDGRTGQHLAGFVAPHSFRDVAFTGDGRYLVGRGDDVGLTVWNAATGKVLVTRREWKRLLEIHAWNRPDLSEIVGDKLFVGHGTAVEVIDLTTGKSVRTLARPGKTMASLAPKSGRVAVFEGASATLTLWNAGTDGAARRVDLARYVHKGAVCTHCTVEFDERDEDRLWLVSTYTSDKLRIDFASGSVDRVEDAERRPNNAGSSTHRLIETYDQGTQGVRCSLGRRDRSAPPESVPSVLCDRSHGPVWRAEDAWPYPGFAPDGTRVASLYDHELQVFDLRAHAMVCSAGRRDAPLPSKPGKRPKTPPP